MRAALWIAAVFFGTVPGGVCEADDGCPPHLCAEARPCRAEQAPSPAAARRQAPSSPTTTWATVVVVGPRGRCVVQRVPVEVTFDWDGIETEMRLSGPVAGWPWRATARKSWGSIAAELVDWLAAEATVWLRKIGAHEGTKTRRGGATDGHGSNTEP
jgi:hypothetical protein